MEIYETDDDYTLSQIEEIELFLDNNIGTEYERNNCGDDSCFYLLVFDLTPTELGLIMKFENEFRKGKKNADI